SVREAQGTRRASSTASAWSLFKHNIAGAARSALRHLLLDPVRLADLAAFAARDVLGEVVVGFAHEVVHVVGAELHLAGAPTLEHGTVLVGKAGFIGHAVHEDAERLSDFVVGKTYFHYFFTVSYRPRF